jgi:hypothetical protein
VHQDGADAAKFEQVWMFETSELFDGRERAALRLAAAAGAVPNAVTDAHFDDLRQYFDDDEILELVAVIAMFGIMNRWNDTLTVTLEGPPMHFAETPSARRWLDTRATLLTRRSVLLSDHLPSDRGVSSCRQPICRTS